MVIGALAGVRTLAVLAGLFALAGAGMWIGLVVHYFNTPGLPTRTTSTRRTCPGATCSRVPG